MADEVKENGKPGDHILSPNNKEHLSHPASPTRLRFEEIPLQDKGANVGTVNQKKIGPLGRKRRQKVNSRHGTLNALPQSNDARECKQLPDGKGFERNKLKRLGFGVSRRGGSPSKSSAPSSSPKTPLKSWFNFGGISNWSWTVPRNVQQNRVDRVDSNGLTALHSAAHCNSVAKVDELLQKGADVNATSSMDGTTPLHIAARYNCPDVAEVLLQYGADVTDVLVTNGQTPLHVCCRRGFLKVAKVLIFTGKADVNSRDKDKTTPLQQATVKGDIDVCTLLVENGAQIRAKDINQVSPLMQAAQYGYQECVQYLLSLALQVGIPINEFLADKDNEGNTALHLAVGNRHLVVAKSLIERGAPVNCKKSTNGYTPLHQAAVMGEEALAQMLIDKGAQTEVTDTEQMTPLHRAALYNRVDTILLLIRQGLFLDTQDEDNFTPLLCAAWKGQTDAGRALLRYGADIKARDKEMKTCLHWAVEMQHVEFIKMLFEHGHDGKDIIDWKDTTEQTALHYAAEVGNAKILNILIENGADLKNKEQEEKTALHISAMSGHLECTEDLLNACPVPLNDDDIDDMTPLLLASENGHHRVVTFLIKMGADIGSRNDDRRSSIALAAKNNNMDVLNVLINNNANVNTVDKDRSTPLHLCAQEGHVAPVSLLLNNGADLRMQNIYGMFPLDVAIEHKQESVAKAILSCNNWQVAMNNVDGNGYTPMRKLIAILPEAALLVMDQCVSRSHTDFHHPNLKVTYDYRYIDPGPDDISFDKNNCRYFALETMVECKQEKLLAHKLSQTCLRKKWNCFARYFNYVDFVFYASFVVLCSLYLHKALDIVRSVNNLVDDLGCPIVNISDDIDYSLWWDKVWFYEQTPNATVYHLVLIEPTALGIQLYILLFVVIRAIIEIIGILRHRMAYFRKGENYLHWTMILPTFFFVFPPFSPPCSWNWQAGVISVFVTWMNFIFVLNRFDFFGLYVTMFFTTLKSLMKAMSVYIFFIIAFALSFYICFQGTNESFRTEWSSIITTFVMTLGEINKSDLLDTGVSLYPFDEVANLLVVIFLFLMPMVLINLTIGISVGDIEQILESSYFKRFSLQVEIILRLEKRFPRRIQRKVWLPKADYWPNRKKSMLFHKLAMWAGGGSNTKFLTKTSEEANKEISNEDLQEDIHRHDAMLSTLTMMVHQQGKLLARIAEKHDIKSTLEDPYSVVELSPRAGEPSGYNDG